MRTIALLPLALVASATSVAAEEITPNEVREKYPLAAMGPCRDHETGKVGTCHIFPTGDGQVYLVFVQNGKPVFMRHTRPDGYDTVWVAPTGVSL